ncbi:MAG TPA: ABC transporter permease [Desulfatiglandales bacterium]|nr:ABC transporter permease [Desulfatiglandales bacterium]
MTSRIFGNKMLVIGGVVLMAMISTALLAPLLAGYDPLKMDFSSVLAPPSSKHLLGTDHFGRDILSRILYGARISIEVGLASIFIGFVGGIIIGAAAGYLGGLVDDILMRMMDGLLAFPALLLAIGLVASMGPSLKTVCLSIGVVYIPRFARVMRSSVLAEREKEYVEAARAIGQSRIKILVRHIGPNCISPVVVMSTVIFALAIIIEATLSFLGIGLPPPTPSWGTMLNESRRYLGTSIYPALFPGLVISFAVLGLNLLGDGLRDLLDPKIYTVKS